jgi:hypothetical protein
MLDAVILVRLLAGSGFEGFHLKKMSVRPPAGAMKPKPRSFKDFTAPSAILFSSEPRR